MIPKIIHQVWEGRENSLPEFYTQLSETWKEHHRSWQYELWNSDRMDALVEEHFPGFAETYFGYRYPVQRWDAIRYLILFKMGGMYVDCDYECLESFDNSIAEQRTCFFAMEPDEHRRAFGKNICFNNALMATSPGHPFFACIIEHLSAIPFPYSGDKFHDVLASTGPLMLTSLYEKYNGSDVRILPADQVSPWSKREVRNFVAGTADEEQLEKKLEKAIAIHYFSGGW